MIHKHFEYAIENPHFAPADEAVVQCLARAIFFGRVSPLKPMFQNVNNVTDHAPVINTRNSGRQGKTGLDASKLLLAEIKTSFMTTFCHE